MLLERSFRDAYRLILDEIGATLERLDPEQVEGLIQAISDSEQVFVIGVGRVMLSLAAFAKRLNHLGIAAHCVGDINEPAITPRDLLIVASGSGESVVPVAIATVARRHGARIAYLGANMPSTIGSLSHLQVRIPVPTKLNLGGEVKSQQIMTSLFEQTVLLLGDAMALALAQRRNVDPAQLWRFHANLE